MLCALRDLTGVTTGTWSEQHRDVHARRRKNIHHLRKFINFFVMHNPFNFPVNQLISIAIGVIPSDDINVDSAVDLGTKIVSGLGDKKLGEIYPLKERTKQKRLQQWEICKRWWNRCPNVIWSTKSMITGICCARWSTFVRYIFSWTCRSCTVIVLK